MPHLFQEVCNTLSKATVLLCRLQEALLALVGKVKAQCRPCEKGKVVEAVDCVEGSAQA
jgi:hypothetical protein